VDPAFRAIEMSRWYALPRFLDEHRTVSDQIALLDRVIVRARTCRDRAGQSHGRKQAGEESTQLTHDFNLCHPRWLRELCRAAARGIVDPAGWL